MNTYVASLSINIISEENDYKIGFDTLIVPIDIPCSQMNGRRLECDSRL